MLPSSWDLQTGCFFFILQLLTYTEVGGLSNKIEGNEMEAFCKTQGLTPCPPTDGHCSKLAYEAQLKFPSLWVTGYQLEIKFLKMLKC